MMRVLVTGANGFVGRHLIAQLLGSGCQVVAACRTPDKHLGRDRRVQLAHFDLDTSEVLSREALADVQCVFHLAARVHVMRPAADEEERFASANITGTRKLAEKAAAAGVRRYVFLSSIKVNGERTLAQPFRADDVPAPADAYGRSKWQAERALQQIAAQLGLEVAIVRAPLVYGPGVVANFKRLLMLARTTLPLPFGGIDNRRSLVNVWNLVDCLAYLGSYRAIPQQTWLVSDGTDVSTPQLIRMMAAAMKRPARMWAVPIGLLRWGGRVIGLRAEIDRLVQSLQVDSEPLRNVLGWRPPLTLEEGIIRTCRWYEETMRAG